MSVIGHKLLNSLSIYQKVSTDKKLPMVYAMSHYLQNEKCIPLINCQPVSMSNEQQKKKSALETAPNTNISSCRDPLTEDQVGYSLNNNNNNQIVPI